MSDDLYRRAKNTNVKGLEKFLGELELAVMNVVWSREPATVSDVLETLHQEKERQLAYTTVMTIMSRLTEKGWLEAEKQGRAFSYRAMHSRQEAEAAAVRSVVRALLEDFGDVAVTQFVKELDDIDPNQLVRLAKLADEPEEADDRSQPTDL